LEASSTSPSGALLQTAVDDLYSNSNVSIPNLWDTSLLFSTPSLDPLVCTSALNNTTVSYAPPTFQLDDYSFPIETNHIIHTTSADQSTPYTTTSTNTSSPAVEVGITSPDTASLHPKPGRKRALSIEEPDLIDKRRRNNVAATKYRKKKDDRVSDLEKSLHDMTKDRDALKIEVAKKDAEIALLNRLLKESRTG